MRWAGRALAQCCVVPAGRKGRGGAGESHAQPCFMARGGPIGPVRSMTAILVILALILINGMLAGAEIGIVAVRKTRLDELARAGSRAAAAALRLRDQPERFLATVQVGITVAGAAAAAL